MVLWHAPSMPQGASLITNKVFTATSLVTRVAPAFGGECQGPAKPGGNGVLGCSSIESSAEVSLDIDQSLPVPASC